MFVAANNAVDEFLEALFKIFILLNLALRYRDGAIKWKVDDLFVAFQFDVVAGRKYRSAAVSRSYSSEGE